jgi:hypothetical protein
LFRKPKEANPSKAAGNPNTAHAAIHPNHAREAIVQAKEVHVQLKLQVVVTNHGATGNAPMNAEAADLRRLLAKNAKAAPTGNALKKQLNKRIMPEA